MCELSTLCMSFEQNDVFYCFIHAALTAVYYCDETVGFLPTVEIDLHINIEVSPSLQTYVHSTDETTLYISTLLK